MSVETIYPAQVRLIQATQAEVLAFGARGGKSHALRLAALQYAFHYRGARIALVSPRHEQLIREHVEGRSGLKAMLAQSPGAAAIGRETIRFGNGSEIFLVAVDRPMDLRRITSKCAIVLVDNAHRISRPLYESWAAIVEQSGGRIIATTGSLVEAGWLGERFTSPEAGDQRAMVEFFSTDLPDELLYDDDEPRFVPVPAGEEPVN